MATWSKIWYFVTAFVSLFLGAWVAAQLSTNTSGGGRLHGAVTWGLTTMATFAGDRVDVLGRCQRLDHGDIRTAAVTTSTAAGNQAAQQAPHVGQHVLRRRVDAVSGDFSAVFCAVAWLR